ncbi:androglobin [Ptiloglossa arizonensis]|uniref:androglobin n=1 Tax=Ptiloglossa arizonensis TaxID=3350558 RepID=UPI003F9ECBB9
MGRSPRTRYERESPRRALTVLSKPRPVTLFLGLDDTRTLSSETVPGLSPCWSHFVYVAQSRDVPLDPKDVKPPLARWKLHRWLKWMIEEGKIDPVEYFVPIRSLKIISPMKNFEKSVVEKFTNPNLNNILEKKDVDDKITSEESSKKSDSSKKSSKRTPKESRKTSPKESQKLENPSVDISFWVDFNKMEPYVKEIHFFYKLDYFQYTARISDRYVNGKLNDQLPETKKGSKRDSRSFHCKESEFTDVYPWPWRISHARNEALYIFVDSLEEKFFLINFSTFQVTDSRSSTVPTLGEGDTKPTNPTRAPAMSRDYLTIEKYRWFHRPKESNNLIHLTTAGTRSTVMELNPGRHLLRMYCRSKTRCYVTISSDTLFVLGNRRKMYEVMSTESMMIDQTAKQISRSVSNAYQAFGTDLYAEALTDYYNSYVPPAENVQHQHRHKSFNNYIHDCFIDEKIQLIKKHLPEDQVPEVLRSLRIFFLNPAIGMRYLNSMSQILQNMREFNIGEQMLETSSLVDVELSDPMLFNEDHAATVIQSLFKGHIVRKYREIHDPRHKEHQGVARNLAKLVELFNYEKRESLANQLLRNMLGHLDRLHDIYPCSRDFKYILQMQELTGRLTNVKPNQWLPVARFTVNSRVTETVRAGVDLFVDLPRYSVRVFDNDTGREMLRVVNNVVTTRYPHSSAGYTIFCYGWSEDRAFKELPWTISVITMKGQPVFYPLNNETSPSVLTLPLLTTEELSNIYIPNVNMCISKWIVRTTNPCAVSFRLRTSYDRVKISFRVTEKSGRVLSEAKGISAVILPFVHLGLPRKSSNLGFLPMDCVTDDNPGSNVNNNRLSNEDENDSTGDLSEAKDSQESLGCHTYCAEAFVLEDSWPLTESEWLTVMESKSRRTSSVRTKSSTSIRSRSSKSEAPRMRKSSKQVNNGGQVLETPYWVLQVVTDSGSSVEVFQDRTKEKELVEMKETWVKDNPDCIKRGRELREAFLAKYEVKAESESSTTDVSKTFSVNSRVSTKRENGAMAAEGYSETSKMEVRTTKPFRRLPSMDYSIYKVSEDEEDKPWIKTAHDEEVLSNIRKMNIIYANEDHHDALEEMKCLLKNRKEKYRELFSEHRDLFWERRALLDEAIEKRKAYIDTTKPLSVQSSKKIVKSKSTKSKSTKSKKV